MFESDQRKELKGKYNKLTAISGAQTSIKRGASPTKKAGDFDISANGPLGSVYGELKLSEKLAQELAVVREQVDHLRESLEEALYQKEKNRSDLE